MLDLLYATGMRVSELTALDLADVDLSDGSVRCQGKGGKERIVPIHPDAVGLVELYIRDSRPELAGEGEPSALFLNRRGNRINPAGVLADPEEVHCGSRAGRTRYPTHTEAQLRHSPAQGWGSTAPRPGATWTRKHHDNADLHSPDQ